MIDAIEIEMKYITYPYDSLKEDMKEYVKNLFEYLENNMKNEIDVSVLMFNFNKVITVDIKTKDFVKRKYIADLTYKFLMNHKQSMFTHVIFNLSD